MPVLYDLGHIYGEDLEESATGDIAVVSNQDRTIQRILRRLMTVATSVGNSQYPTQPTYGAGLGAKIGEPGPDVRSIQGIVQAQMRTEALVARVPAPIVTVTPLAIGGATINVAYTDLSGQPQSFNFDVTD
jgi:hypothetical protein